jgi:hypothetical protein
MHILLGLLVAFVVIVLIARTRGQTRTCRWRADRTGDRGNMARYHCAACGAEAYTATGAPPQICKNPRRG